ncbi:MAG TPA: hypothetical protein VMR33_11900 [Candidatus Baltobacteraceae bacterium]|nr:hypothetical protein [Candidatus Baltobacteraceae bacterium]
MKSFESAIIMGVISSAVVFAVIFGAMAWVTQGVLSGIGAAVIGAIGGAVIALNLMEFMGVVGKVLLQWWAAIADLFRKKAEKDK